MNPGEWAALVGWGRDGRAQVTRDVVASLRARGLKLGGCVQETLTDDGEIVGYDLVDLDDGRRLPLARPSTDPQVCNWGFSEHTFATIAARVLDRPYDLVVLELGPIEARGHGHWPTVTRMLERAATPLLLCIRPRVLARIALDLPDPALALELPAADEQVAHFVDGLGGARLPLDHSGRAPQQRP